jgi:uncharacterized cupredoxin-like copper-binding protein
MRLRTVSATTLLCALLACLLSSAASAERAVALPHSLEVSQTEWATVPSAGAVAAGMVRLRVENAGRLYHELEIVPTRTWGEPLPVSGGRAVVGEVAARPIIVRPGRARSARIFLQPGYYVLLDNIRGHYQAGSAVSIVVL